MASGVFDDILIQHLWSTEEFRNVFNDRDQNYAYAIGSPRYVKFASEGEYGVNFQFGIKGNF